MQTYIEQQSDHFSLATQCCFMQCCPCFSHPVGIDPSLDQQPGTERRTAGLAGLGEHVWSYSSEIHPAQRAGELKEWGGGSDYCDSVQGHVVVREPLTVRESSWQKGHKG